MICALEDQGLRRGSCGVKTADGSLKPACQAVVKNEAGEWSRLIESAHLSRPEHYFSVYMSGCNMSCMKCHSAEFSKYCSGKWMTVDELAARCAEYATTVTVKEPRERALMYYAAELCRSCGSCLRTGKRGDGCPGALDFEQILLSPQGYGPARNIIGYTGGDLACQVDYYAALTKAIKARCTDMHVLFETNGYGLTDTNLERLKAAGVDSFWLDIKAYDNTIHQELCGVPNDRILTLPARMIDHGFVLEVLSLFIPGWVEDTQVIRIGEIIAEVDPTIPFTLLAFFPAYKLRSVRAPTALEMVRTYQALRNIGLVNLRLGNMGVFVHTIQDLLLIEAVVGTENVD